MLASTAKKGQMIQTRWAFLVTALLVASLAGILVWWLLTLPDGTKQAGTGSPAVTEEERATRTDVDEKSSNANRDETEVSEDDPFLEHALTPWTGDLDGMIERRMIRVLVAYSKTFFFLDGAKARGISYESLQKFETQLNKKLKRKTMKVNVMFIPVSRDRLVPGLVGGLGDLAVANLTITPERAEHVDFSDPLLSDVSEVVVTGPAAPPVASVDDLAGMEIVVRRSSSYYDSVMQLNQTLKAAGKPEMRLTFADENLEDEDLLEMVNAGLYPMIVMDNHKAAFWKQVLDDITIHSDITVRTGGQIAWAMRKNSPKLKNAVNAFVKDHKAGTEFGNIMLRRYLKETKYVKNAVAEEERKKFLRYMDQFRKHGDSYDLDWLLIAAQAYQESGLDQNSRSRAGAVGVMQIKPTTAAGDPINIKNIKSADSNIHAGVKYLRYLIDTYFTDEAIDPFNRHLLALAAYNAGPTRISKLRKGTAKSGLDPNTWFNNVERVVAKNVGREPVQYIRNILKYYVAYKRILEQTQARRQAKDEMKTE